MMPSHRSKVLGRTVDVTCCYMASQMVLQRRLDDLQAGRFLELQASEKAARDAAAQHLYSNNAPQPGYFDQFQSSHR